VNGYDYIRMQIGLHIVSLKDCGEKAFSSRGKTQRSIAATKAEKNMGTTNYTNQVPAKAEIHEKKSESAARRGGPPWPPAIVIPAEAGIH
jgi:hypothetical protein